MKWAITPVQSGKVAVITAAFAAGPDWLAEAIPELETELVAKHGDEQQERIERGLRQVANFWRAEDGDRAEFETFVITNFAGDQETLDTVFERFESLLEKLERARVVVERSQVEEARLLLAAAGRRLQEAGRLERERKREQACMNIRAAESLIEKALEVAVRTDVVQGEVFSVNTDEPRDVKSLQKSDGPCAPLHFMQAPDAQVCHADLVLGTIGRLAIADAA